MVHLQHLPACTQNELFRAEPRSPARRRRGDGGVKRHASVRSTHASDERCCAISCHVRYFYVLTGLKAHCSLPRWMWADRSVGTSKLVSGGAHLTRFAAIFMCNPCGTFFAASAEECIGESTNDSPCNYHCRANSTHDKCLRCG